MAVPLNSESETQVPTLRTAVVLVRDENILLARHQKKGNTYWVLPGGHVEQGEDPAEAAARELEEECGLEVEVGDLLWVCDSIATSADRHVINLIYEARWMKGVLKKGEDFGVLAEVAYKPLDSLPSLTFYPDTVKEILDWSAGKQNHRPLYLGIR